MRQLLRALGIMAMGLCGLAAHAQTLLRDDRGTVHRFDTAPQRIISLLPSLTETVCALGACNRLVGVDRYSNEPVQVSALPKLGGLEDAQVERIVALKPDVVLATPSARITDRLTGLGIRVVLLASDSHADVRRSLTSIAQMLGTPQEAERVWATIEHEIATAAQRVPVSLRGRRVYFEVGAAPYAAGSTSFIGQTLARMGMANVVPTEMGPFPKLNPEFVVRSKPDIVMASQRDLRTMASRPGWQSLEALPQGHSCGFDPAHYELLIRPGPRLGQGALLLAACLVAMPSQDLR